jgi:preprotein translocase subunit SecD
MKNLAIVGTLLFLAGCATSSETKSEPPAPLPSPVFELRLAGTEAKGKSIPTTVRSTGETVYLAPEASLTVDDLASAEAVPGRQTLALKLTFTRSGMRRFAELTEQHQGEALAVIIGGETITASVIRAAIKSGVLVLEGYYTEEEVRNIAAALSRR